MEDSGLYEIVAMEGPAQFVQGLLEGSGGGAGIAVADRWGSPMRPQDPGFSVSSNDAPQFFRRALENAECIAIWDETIQRYRVVECETQAGAVRYNTTADIQATPVGVTKQEVWGTQQDIQDPGAGVDVRNPLLMWRDAPAVQSGIAIFDQEAGNYVTIAAQEVALFITFTLVAPLEDVAGVWRSPVGSDATVTSYSRGSSPGSSATVVDASQKWKWKAISGAKGVAVRAFDTDPTTAVWYIVECQTVAEWVNFTLTGALAKTDADVSAVPLSTNQGHIPGGAWHNGQLAPPGDQVHLYNPAVSNDGPYQFEGNSGAEGQARLCESATTPAGDFPYQIYQMECPPEE
jgi:hypothetical protein